MQLQHLRVGKPHHDWLELPLTSMLNRRPPADGTLPIRAEAATGVSAHSPLAGVPLAGTGRTSTQIRVAERR